MKSCYEKNLTILDIPLNADERPFAGEIMKYKFIDGITPPAGGGIVFIGSSTIALWNTLSEDFKQLPVINRGFGGSQAEHALLYADTIVIPYKPNSVVYYEGDNDIAAGKSVEQILDDVNSFVIKVKSSLPAVKIYILSVKPSPSRIQFWNKTLLLNKRLKEFADKTAGIKFIDITSVMFDSAGEIRKELFKDDKLHMNDDGYKLWTGVIKEFLTAGF